MAVRDTASSIAEGSSLERCAGEKADAAVCNPCGLRREGMGVVEPSRVVSIPVELDCARSALWLASATGVNTADMPELRIGSAGCLVRDVRDRLDMVWLLYVSYVQLQRCKMTVGV